MKTKNLVLFLMFLSVMAFSESISLRNTLIDPFLVYFEKYNYHIISYFTNHEKYECIEAMIKNANNIRIILTYKDKTQIDYLNNEAVFLSMKEESKNRTIIFTPIECKLDTKKAKPEISINFTTNDKESVSWFFQCVDKPSEKYGGLVNPQGHSEHTSFPIMYREKSTLGSKNVKLTIDNKVMNIPVEINKAPFFVALKSYYSESFLMGIIRTSNDPVCFLTNSILLTNDETLMYKLGEKTLSYKIGIDNNQIIMRGNNCLIHATVVKNEMVINSIHYFLKENNNDTLVLNFSPGLCLSGIAGTETSFSIDINKYKNIITGVVKITNDKNEIRYMLTPRTPDWASRRLATIHMIFNNDDAKRIAEIE
ncbi:MAG TPA: hypothetical protein PLW34_00740 [Termitinemataceae bacterium]|uniref:hypothetical protein n=1 Tax=Treponema sp. J25 TaxID=2094121 RepID=UPI00104CCB5D|nr:hypothetical protein [Treponema sp. J25]TCW60098.1 hypothetical protein C5O22_13115 [Treponema sp. J25]HOJ98072.1 hypothetical protein [Termitinemataceae bacterium]HOM22319.1 hypothetical protein [Termitinemataceae bacterium]HPP99259.1 hypothetical protein [Termitinemataceae bacterium]